MLIQPPSGKTYTTGIDIDNSQGGTVTTGLQIDAGTTAILVDAGDVIFDEDLIVGGSGSRTETLANAAFTLDGDDLFVAGMAGIEGSVYTDSSFIAGSSLTLNDTGITDSNSDINFTSTTDGFNFAFTDGGAGDDFIINTNLFVAESDNNRIGVGMTDPAGKFEIYDATSTPVLVLSGDGDYPFFYLDDQVGAYQDDVGLYSTGGRLKWRDETSAKDIFSVRLDTGNEGNVGIGQIDPAAQLEVEIASGDNVPGILIDFDDSANNGNALVINNAGSGYSILVDEGDTVLDEDLVIGGSTSRSETLANAGFTLGGDDLFVAGVAGIEGMVYTDTGLTIGSATTVFTDGDIETSSALTINNTNNQSITTGSGLFTVGNDIDVVGNIEAGSSDIVLTLDTGYIDADAITLNGGTLSVTSDGLHIANAGITATQLAASVAGDGLIGGAGSVLAINPDDVTIEIDIQSMMLMSIGGQQQIRFPLLTCRWRTQTHISLPQMWKLYLQKLALQKKNAGQQGLFPAVLFPMPAAMTLI